MASEAQFYSSVQAVRDETGIKAADLDIEATGALSAEDVLDARIEEWLVAVKALIDAYTNRDFLEETRIPATDSTPEVPPDPARVSPAIHLIAERAAANMVAAARLRRNTPRPQPDEYRVEMYRDEVMSPSIRRELDLFVGRGTAGKRRVGFGRMRNARELEEAGVVF